MAKQLKYEIVTDASKGIAGLNQFSSAVKKSMKEVESSSATASSAAEKVSKALSGVAQDIETEMQGAAKAAKALGKALGPDIAGRADLDSIVKDLKRMGLTFEEITADADTLAVGLRDLDRVQLGAGMDEFGGSARKAAGDVDEIGKSAGSSKSVLANMIGNSVQDLGALGGVAGSAGVAIGQMGEYMADAAGDGEKLGAVIGNFAKIAGPLALVAVATQAVSAGMKNVAAEEKHASDVAKIHTDNIEAITKILQEGGSVADAYAAHLRDLGKIDLTIDGSHLLPVALDVSKSLLDVGGSLTDFSTAVTGSDDDLAAFVQQVRATDASVFEQNAVIDAATQQHEDYAKAVEQSAKWNKLSAISAKDAAKAARDYANALKGFDASNAAAEQAKLHDQLVLTNEAISLNIPGALQKAAAMEKVAAATRDAAKAQEEFGTKKDLFDLGSFFSQAQIANEAMRSAFDLGNAPADAAAAVFDIQDGLRDFVKFVKDDLKGVIPKILDPKDIHAGDFLNKIEGLRGPIQQKVIEAFGNGGAPAALAVGEAYIKQLSAILGKAFGPGVAEELIFPGGLQARIDVAIDEKSMVEAKKELEILTGLTGNNAWTAAIQLALDSGELTPEAVRVLAQRALKDRSIPIPAAIEEPDTGKAKAAADKFTRENKVLLPSSVEEPTDTDLTTAKTKGEDFAKANHIQWPVDLVMPKATPPAPLGRFAPRDAGGTVPGPWGGLVAERRPEIINERFLVTEPTIVPPGTRVTSGARTARILRTRGTRGLRRYDRGGVVAGGGTTININAAVIGNRFDVMRAVQRANNDKQRLLGSR